jgi:hypothetical protein
MVSIRWRNVGWRGEEELRRLRVPGQKGLCEECAGRWGSSRVETGQPSSGCSSPLREGVMSAKVVYAGKNGPDHHLYIGREHSGRGVGPSYKRSDWCNPYQIDTPGKKRDGTREEVIAKFESYIRAPEQAHLRARLSELEGKTLACWCAGKPGIPEVLTGTAVSKSSVTSYSSPAEHSPPPGRGPCPRFSRCERGPPD